MIKTMLDEGYTLAKASEEIKKSHQKADMLHVLMSTRLQDIQYDDQQTLLNFGPLENDPTYDVVAVVNEKNAKLYKQPIKPSAAINQQTTDNLLK